MSQPEIRWRLLITGSLIHGLGLLAWLVLTGRAAWWWSLGVDGYDGWMFFQLALPLPLALAGLLMQMRSTSERGRADG